MALRLAGEARAPGERVWTRLYIPSVANSGDLEPTTRTVTATAKRPGPDYTASLTLPPAPPEVRVLRVGLRVGVTLDTLGGTPQATTLFLSVEVDGMEVASGQAGAPGTLYLTTDLPEGAFVLGAPMTVRVYLWVDQGEAVVSACQVWMGVGSTATGSRPSVVALEHRGLMALLAVVRAQGSGTPSLALRPARPPWYDYAVVSGQWGSLEFPAFLAHGEHLAVGGTVAGDLNFLEALILNLRREE